MIAKSLIKICVLFFLPLFSQAYTFKISVSKNVEVPKVNAEVTIVNGNVIQNNCTSLTEEDQDGVTYTLKQEGLNFYCVPSPTTRKVKRTESYEMEEELTMAVLIREFAEIGKSYEEEEGVTQGYFSTMESQTPSCQIKNDGTVNFSTCVCEQELQSYDHVTKACKADPTVVSFYTYDCSDQHSLTKSVLEVVGASVFPPPSFSFAVCSVGLNHYRVIPHDLVPALLYFAYSKAEIKKAVNAQDDEDIKLILTQSEFDEFIAWGVEWSESEDAQNYPEPMRPLGQRLRYDLRGYLGDIIEIQ